MPYNIQTLRGAENFLITGYRIHPALALLPIAVFPLFGIPRIEECYAISPCRRP